MRFSCAGRPDASLEPSRDACRRNGAPTRGANVVVDVSVRLRAGAVEPKGGLDALLDGAVVDLTPTLGGYTDGYFHVPHKGVPEARKGVAQGGKRRPGMRR